MLEILLQLSGLLGKYRFEWVSRADLIPKVYRLSELADSSPPYVDFDDFFILLTNKVLSHLINNAPIRMLKAKESQVKRSLLTG